MSKTPTPKDAIAQITVTLYANGMVSTGGSIGDKGLAVALLQHALDEIRAQLRPEDGRLIYTPSRNVEVAPHPHYPIQPAGDR